MGEREGPRLKRGGDVLERCVLVMVEVVKAVLVVDRCYIFLEYTK